MKRIVAAALALMLLLTSCAPAPTTDKQPNDAQAAAVSLLNAAIDELFLYQGDIAVNKDAEPYYTEDGRKYYPVNQYHTIAELRTHSRRIFTEDFCANVLDDWAQHPGAERFVERDGKLWETNSVGNMGWVILLIPESIEIVSMEDDRCVLSAYSQVLTGEVTREEFLMLREPDGWRLDSYYNFNRTLPQPVIGATVADYMAELSDGNNEVYRLGVKRSDGSILDVDESMILPFSAILEAIEYDESSVTTVDDLPPKSDEEAGLEMVIYNGTCELSGYDDGAIYITKPNGEIIRLQMLYPGGLKLLTGVIDAARWHLRDFGAATAVN